MADRKISELSNITGSNVADTDEFVLVDTSADETKAITASELRTAIGNGDFTVTGDLTVQGTTITVDSATAQNIVLGDNDKMTFGAGSDLQIYHDGTHSYVTDEGTGALYLRGAGYVYIQKPDGTQSGRFDTDGAVDLFYNGAEKFSTTSTGIDVTGTVTADGLTVGAASLPKITLSDTDGGFDDVSFTVVNGGRDLQIVSPQEVIIKDAGTAANWLRIDEGDISFYEDTGTTAKFFWDASAESLGIGTTSPATPLHIVTSGNTAATFHSTTDNSNIVFTDASTTANVAIGAVSGNNFRVQVNNAERMRIDSSGNFGIGTSSPAHKLHVADATTPEIIVEDTTNNVKAVLGADNSVGRIGTDTNHPVTFRTNDTERMRIDSSGNVGIGTSSPNNLLHLYKASGGNYSIVENTSGKAAFGVGSGGEVTISAESASNPIRFLTSSGGSERMRIDSSGNLLVGKTSTATGAGFEARSDGQIVGTRSANRVAFLNRLTSDGDIVQFAKDGTTVGSIGATSGDMFLGTDNTGLRFVNAGSDIRPFDPSTTSIRDAAIDLGDSTARFKDLYLSGNVAASNSSSLQFGSTSCAIEGTSSGADYIKITTNSSERMRIDSSGNLLVGQSTYSVNNGGIRLRQDGEANFSRSGQPTIFLNRVSSDGEIARFTKDGSTVGSIGANSSKLFIGTGSANIRFRDDLSAILPTDADGSNSDADLDLGYSSVRWRDLYLSGGVYLGGTGSANKLDDYEEGTWTPTLSGATTTTYTTNTGQYVKVGALVHVQCEININSVGNGDTNTVLGLPFANNGKTSALAVGFLRNVATNYYSVALRIDAGTSRIEFEMQTGLDGNNSTNNFFANGTRVMFSGTYYTTS